MDDRLDEQLDDWIKDTAQSYHEPPVPPRDAMWTAIQEGRRAAPVIPIRRPVRWVTWTVGVAAVLALGIGIGRLIPAEGSDPSVATVETPSDPMEQGAVSVALAVATTEHLTQAETFLTLFRDAVRSGQPSGYASGTARHLLATNRLITDTPVATDPALKELLQDLELVLAQIAQLTDDAWEGETDLITDGIEQRAVLTRLQSVVPAGTPRVVFSL